MTDRVSSSEGTGATLSLTRTIARAFGHVLGRPTTVLVLSWKTIVGLYIAGIAVTWLVNFPNEIVRTLVELSIAAISFSVIATNWHQKILGDVQIKSIVMLTKYVSAVVLGLVVFGVIPYIIHNVNLSVRSFFLQNLVIFFIFFGSYVVARFSLILPQVALTGTMSFAASWAATRGRGLKLWGGLIFLFLLTSALFEIVKTLLAVLGDTSLIFLGVISFLIFLLFAIQSGILAAFLSEAYSSLVTRTSEPRPTAA